MTRLSLARHFWLQPPFLNFLKSWIGALGLVIRLAVASEIFGDNFGIQAGEKGIKKASLIAFTDVNEIIFTHPARRLDCRWEFSSSHSLSDQKLQYSKTQKNLKA